MGAIWTAIAAGFVLFEPRSRVAINRIFTAPVRTTVLLPYSRCQQAFSLSFPSDRLIQRKHRALRISQHSNRSHISHQFSRHESCGAKLGGPDSRRLAVGNMEVGHPVR